jgi:dolichol kinase
MQALKILALILIGTNIGSFSSLALIAVRHLSRVKRIVADVLIVIALVISIVIAFFNTPVLAWSIIVGSFGSAFALSACAINGDGTSEEDFVKYKKRMESCNVE